VSRSVAYAPAPIHGGPAAESSSPGIFASAADELFRTQHKGLIPWLDLLRTVAILLVVGEHCLELGFTGPASRAFYWGWTGVDLFFILSGFLIGRQLWKELRDTHTIKVGRFLLRRGLRIWPLYFTAVLGYFIWSVVAGLNLRPLLSDLFFVSNYFHCRVKGGWSLSTEEQFYIAAPVLLFLFRFVQRRYLVLVPVLWMAVLPLLRYSALAHAPGVPVSDVIYSPIHLHSDGLAAGLILSWLSVFCPKWWSSGKSAIWLPCLVIATGLALRFLGKDVFSYSALALIYGGTALFGLRVHAANRLASWRGLFVISRLSYGTYLNHLVLIEALPAAWVQHIGSAYGTSTVAFLAAFLTVCAVSLSIAFVTFALIERPGLQWRERLLEAPRPKARAAAAMA
jgi:peptidoglycan/LPS O-acetylase OafA/YrhL